MPIILDIELFSILKNYLNSYMNCGQICPRSSGWSVTCSLFQSVGVYLQRQYSSKIFNLVAKSDELKKNFVMVT